jgi:hypothetical protein
MEIDKKNRKYFSFEPTKGYPADKNIYYECMQCGDILLSLPDNNQKCSCKNISIDIDSARIYIKNDNLIKMFTFD